VGGLSYLGERSALDGDYDEGERESEDCVFHRGEFRALRRLEDVLHREESCAGKRTPFKPFTYFPYTPPGVEMPP
jgi:hypothetical protein